MDVLKSQTESPDILGFPQPAQWNYSNINNNGPFETLQHANVVSNRLN